jgi:peptidyl-prolyl cis-trans isomerase B (cyclophilin B)
MKRLIILLSLITCQLSLCIAQERAEVLMETSEGNIRIQLYNETPLHRDNFLRLVKAHYYDSLLFHRVIKNFMIQGGNRNTRQAEFTPEFANLCDSLDYTIEAEFRLPKLFHKRGVIAAAREGDDVNPQKRSSSTQFYFVWGRKYSERAMEFTESRLDIELTPEMREAYMTVGGTPHLDGSYTVFGEIVEGLDVVERIQGVETDEGDRPLQPVMIIKATVVKEP